MSVVPSSADPLTALSPATEGEPHAPAKPPARPPGPPPRSSQREPSALSAPVAPSTVRVPPPPMEVLDPASVALEEELLSQPVREEEGTPAAPAMTPPPAAVAAWIADRSVAETSADTPSPQSVELALKLERAAGLARTVVVPFRQTPVRALAWFVLLAAIPYAHPSLKALRLVKAPWDKSDTTQVAEGAPTGITPQYGEVAVPEAQNDDKSASVAPEEPIPETFAPWSEPGSPQSYALSEFAESVGAKQIAIEDPSGKAMEPFWASLAKTEKGAPGAITRVAHYGDSLLVSDLVSSTARKKFQARFGDAGHGFILIAKPWEWYHHEGINHSSSAGWRMNRIVNPRISDEMYGYGGATFRSNAGGTKASFSTLKQDAKPKGDPKEDIGHRASRIDVHYLEEPQGGSFDIFIDGKKVKTVDTKAAQKRYGVASASAEDGEHAFEVRVVGGQEIRLFGVAVERDTAGVVWDALGMNGARARLLDVQDDAHWAQALKARNPALVVLEYGANESGDTGLAWDKYEASLEKVLVQVRTALPGSACLVMGAMDRAGAGAGGLESRPIIPKLVEAQRKVALKTGCAFWNTYEAMGGPGSMGRWTKTKPRLASGDLTHPSPAGGQLIGELLFGALMTGYQSAPKVPSNGAAPKVAPATSGSTGR
jgi:lysophospholipase L1-like esterase